MIKRILFACIPAMFLVFSSHALAEADDLVPVSAVKASSVISMVQSRGYHSVFDFNIDDNAYVVKALDNENEVVRLKIDVYTNKVMHVYETDHHVNIRSHRVTMLDAVRKVEWLGGVRQIYDVDLHDGAYEIRGFNVNQQKVKYSVNANTGEVTRIH